MSESVLLGDEMENAAHGYFLQNELLVRKWVPYEGSFVGEPVFQFVEHEKVHDMVSKIAHEESSHMGMKKT